MIRSWRDKRVEEIAKGQCPKGFPADIVRRTQRKLAQLNAASSLDDLRVPPSNHLEKLSHNRRGQHSIRINSQWRICFIWKDDGPHELEIVDYH